MMARGRDAPRGPEGVLAALRLAMNADVVVDKPGNVSVRTDARGAFAFLRHIDAAMPLYKVWMGGVVEFPPTFLALCDDLARHGNTHFGAHVLLLPLARVVAREVAQDRGWDPGGIRSALLDEVASMGPDCSLAFIEGLERVRPGAVIRGGPLDVTGADVRDRVRVGSVPFGRLMVSGPPGNTTATEVAEGFPLVLGSLVPWLLHDLGEGTPIDRALQRAFVRLIAEGPLDAHILARRGEDAALLARHGAREAWDSMNPVEPGRSALESLHGTLVGMRANPGTTANLVMAALFIVLALAPPAGPVVFR